MSSDPLDGLTDDHCRYIIGDPTSSDWHYCRAPRSRHPDGSLVKWMWCDLHRARVVVKQNWGRRPRRARLDPLEDAA
jgi:hypothetical protein